MVIKRIDIGFEKLKRIYHIADLHFRLVRRHEEYRIILSKFYEDIKETGTEDSIIAILGDVVHSKLDLSPEIVDEASDFLRTCANICPTFLVAGNHDCNLSNKNRLDSLSPLVKNLNHPNLFYLRETGVYKIANCLFNNMSVFDGVDEYIKTTDIPETYKRRVDHLIGLFHGPITGATTDIGYVVTRSTPISLFDGNHIVLCGDIHKKQVIQEYDERHDKPIILYPGACIQQNHGEDLAGHGYVVWNVEKRTFKHVEIPNDYGFYTVEIHDGKLTTALDSIPKKAHLRIKCFNSDVTEVKRVVTDIRKVCDMTEITYIRSEDKNLIKKSGLDKINFADIANVDFQNKLIIDYLRSDQKLDDESVKIIQSINKELNGKIASEDRLRNVRWIPKKFEFDNMFSYGEGNVVDFSKMKNTMGLFAANATGKSALMDALSFCIFDKSSRTFKACNIMNNEKMSFWCKFNFEINGIDYFIERSATRNKKGDVKVDVVFWKIENGERVDLNGEARRGTNDIIRDYVGTYDDFILTALSLQGNNSNIIDKGQSDRKDLLAQFMGINIFDKLYNQALEEMKEVTTLLKNFSKEDYTKKLADTEQKIDVGSVNYKKLVETYENLVEARSELNDSIIEKNSQIIKLLNVVDDVEKVKSDKEVAENKKSSKESLIGTKKKEVDVLREEKTKLEAQIKSLKDNKIEENYEEYLNLCDELSDIELDIDKLKTSVASKIEKLKHLDEHEYDPNCKYCMNNIFVKDAIKTREELVLDKTYAVELVQKSKATKSKIEAFGDIKTNHKQFIDSLKLLDSKTVQLDRGVSEIKALYLEINNLTTKIKSFGDAIDLYNQSITSISKNKEIEKELAILKKKLENLEKITRDKNKEVMELNGNLVLWKSQKSEIEQKIEKTKELENKTVAYEYYVSAVKRDGVPFDLIVKTIPIIENEINNILSQIVEFGVIINVEEKNINLNIVYEDRCWPLELSSGMERFIASLAIRVALINISNLPRPNFIAVDEGFGALDANNMSSVFSLLTYLKTQFEFMIIVSHLDVMRDFVDAHIEVKKENGFSKVVYN